MQLARTLPAVMISASLVLPASEAWADTIEPKSYLCRQMFLDMADGKTEKIGMALISSLVLVLHDLQNGNPSLDEAKMRPFFSKIGTDCTAEENRSSPVIDVVRKNIDLYRS